MTEYVLRFMVGGLFVSLFAIIGDVARPQSFAGLFGAAPSVALATLGIAWAQHDLHYASVQASSMVLWRHSLALLQRRCLPDNDEYPRQSPDSDTGLASGLVDRCPWIAYGYSGIAMQIQLSTSSLSDGRWYERHLIRFALGGVATVLTGLISSAFCASIGGLFLALPAFSAPAQR